MPVQCCPGLLLYGDASHPLATFESIWLVATGPTGTNVIGDANSSSASLCLVPVPKVRFSHMKEEVKLTKTNQNKM